MQTFTRNQIIFILNLIDQYAPELLKNGVFEHKFMFIGEMFADIIEKSELGFDNGYEIKFHDLKSILNEDVEPIFFGLTEK